MQIHLKVNDLIYNHNGVILSFVGTHALVRFVDEDATAVVPRDRLVEKGVGNLWDILWTNKKRYKASCIMSGLFLSS